jgi:hypothetical protein
VSVAGIGGGIVLARASAVLVRSLIWGVQPADPVTFAAAALVGLAVAALAVVIPTMRVLSLSSVDALRNSSFESRPDPRVASDFSRTATSHAAKIRLKSG